MTMNWHTKLFPALTITELYQIIQLRCAVFVVEQNCPYQDMDNKDQDAVHLWCSNNKGEIVAYCRLLSAGVSYKEPSIGRVVTALSIRKNGTGRLLLQQAINYIRTKWSNPDIRISAQLYLQPFYTSLGFITVSEPYMEDDIPHIEMLLTAT